MRRTIVAGSVLAASLWMALPEAAWACQGCFGAGVDTATTRGIGLAMLALLGMTGTVGLGILGFFVNVSRRTRMLEPGESEVTPTGEIRPRGGGDGSI